MPLFYQKTVTYVSSLSVTYLTSLYTLAAPPSVVGQLMKKFLRALLIPIFLLQWVWFLLFCFIFSKQPKQLTNLIQNNEPTEFVEARNYFTDLSDYAVQGNQLYILYDNAAVLEILT